MVLAGRWRKGAKLGERSRKGKCFRPPILYSALQRSLRLSAGGDELRSFTFGSSVSNTSLRSLIEVPRDGRPKKVFASRRRDDVFCVFRRKGNALVVHKYFSQRSSEPSGEENVSIRLSSTVPFGGHAASAREVASSDQFPSGLRRLTEVPFPTKKCPSRRPVAESVYKPPSRRRFLCDFRGKAMCW